MEHQVHVTPPTEEGQTLRMVERTDPSCARATAARVWWSLREKSVAGGLKRPRRSCGHWLAPRRRHCRDGCTAVPEPLGTGDGHASWLALRRRQWLTAFWAKRVLPVRETRCRQSTRWWLTPGFWCSALALVQNWTDTSRSSFCCQKNSPNPQDRKTNFQT